MMMNRLHTFLNDDEAATAVEYAIMLAGIILTAIAGIFAVGESTSGLFITIDTEMQSHGIGP
jgi:Flp pilus assembly pilin Flp